jgi:ribosomal protein L40E
MKRPRPAGKVITICFGCAGARFEPSGRPCRRCRGSGIDPRP